MTQRCQGRSPRANPRSRPALPRRLPRRQPKRARLRRPISTLIQTGRNDPCRCGSGRTFKICHGAVPVAAVAAVAAAAAAAERRCQPCTACCESWGEGAIRGHRMHWGKPATCSSRPPSGSLRPALLHTRRAARIALPALRQRLARSSQPFSRSLLTRSCWCDLGRQLLGPAACLDPAAAGQDAPPTRLAWMRSNQRGFQAAGAAQASRPACNAEASRPRPMNTRRLPRGSPSCQGRCQSPSSRLCTD